MSQDEPVILVCLPQTRADKINYIKSILRVADEPFQNVDDSHPEPFRDAVLQNLGKAFPGARTYLDWVDTQSSEPLQFEEIPSVSGAILYDVLLKKSLAAFGAQAAENGPSDSPRKACEILTANLRALRGSGMAGQEFPIAIVDYLDTPAETLYLATAAAGATRWKAAEQASHQWADVLEGAGLKMQSCRTYLRDGVYRIVVEAVAPAEFAGPQN
ncbi:MAG: hypothetical protein V1820_03425 [archaeon]